MKKGFTLIEVLVALAVFSTAVTIVTDVFLMSAKAQRKILATQRLQADARFVLETMAREARMGTGVTSPNEGQLILKDNEGKQIIFSLWGTKIQVTKENLMADITPTDIKVTQLKFNILSNRQPARVTILLVTEMEEPPLGINPQVVLQTTVSGRNF